MEERTVMRKIVRKDGNRVGFGALIYIVIGYGIMYWLPYLLSKLFPDEGIWAELDGIGSITAVLAGITFLFLFFRKQGTAKQLFVKEKKMTPAILLGAVCVMSCAKLAGGFLASVPEVILNMFGYSMMSGLEAVNGIGRASFTLFLYAGFIGPIAEELVYRGFLMRHLQKYGKMAALVGSAVMFGLMHCNLGQSISAGFAGLVFAYVAMEYSVIWSIVLHIFNNLVIGDLLGRALSGCSEVVQMMVPAALMVVFAIVGIVIVIRKGRELTAWRRENAWQKPRMRWVITSVGAILFVVFTLVFTLRSIGPM